MRFRDLIAPAPTKFGAGVDMAGLGKTLLAMASTAFVTLVSTGVIDQWLTKGGAELSKTLPPTIVAALVSFVTNYLHQHYGDPPKGA